MGHTIRTLQLRPGSPWQVQEHVVADVHPFTVVSREKTSLLHVFCAAVLRWGYCLSHSSMAFASQKGLQTSAVLTPCYSVGQTLVFPAYNQCSWNIRTHPFSTPLIKTWNRPSAWLPNSLYHNPEFLPPGRTTLPPENHPLTTTPPDSFGLSSLGLAPSAKEPRSRSMSPSVRLWCQLWASVNSEDPRFRQSHLERNPSMDNNWHYTHHW